MDRPICETQARIVALRDELANERKRSENIEAAALILDETRELEIDRLKNRLREAQATYDAYRLSTHGVRLAAQLEGWKLGRSSAVAPSNSDPAETDPECHPDCNGDEECRGTCSDSAQDEGEPPCWDDCGAVEGDGITPEEVGCDDCDMREPEPQASDALERALHGCGVPSPSECAACPVSSECVDCIPKPPPLETCPHTKRCKVRDVAPENILHLYCTYVTADGERKKAGE